MSEKFRLTRQRKIILEELKKVSSHPSADKVYAMIRKRLPRISLGTVYRNLEILSKRGLIRKIETGGSQKRFDGNPDNHYHIRCISCDSLEDLRMDHLISINKDLSRFTNYEILGHQIELIGICPRCQKETKAKIDKQ